MLETVAWMLVGATLLPAHRAALESSRQQLVALLALDAIALALIVVASSSVDTYVAISQEDGSVEWATFLSFVLAAGFLVAVVRKASPSRWFQGACVLLALFCLAVAGEEISWGQRLFGFKPPDIFLERNFQQELNLHNVLMREGGLGVKIESKHLVMLIALGFGLAWPLIVQRGRFRVFAPLAPPLAFMPIAIGIVAIEKSYPVELTGEGAELMTGLMFLAAALAATDLRPRRMIAWMAAPMIGGAVLALVLSRIVFGSDEDGQRLARAELVELQAEVTHGARPKLLGKSSVHKRLFTAARDGYLQLAGAAPARRDRHGYFLDPWNNPYWIAYDRKARRITLYSFGPDRRRDVDIRRPGTDVGDDVVVTFVVAPAPEPEPVPDAPPEPP
jgi:hypothetical protein